MLARGNSVICIYHSLAFLTSITSVHFHTCSLMWYWSGMCLIPSCRNCCATPATCWDEAEEHFLVSPVPGSLLWPHTGLEGWVRFRTVWDFICARTGQTCTVQAGQLFLTQASSKWNPWQVFFMLLYREVTRNHLKTVLTKQQDSQQLVFIQGDLHVLSVQADLFSLFYLSPQRDFLHQIIVSGGIWVMWNDAVPCFWYQVLQK